MRLGNWGVLVYWMSIRVAVVQEKKKDSEEQLKMRTHQMNKLATENSELESRNKILKHVVRINADCVDRLQSHKVCCSASDIFQDNSE